jgi:hypothetical protein
MHILIKSFGMRRIIIPAGRESSPRTMDVAHCAPVSLVTVKAVPPTKMIIICPPIMMKVMTMKNRLR